MEENKKIKILFRHRSMEMGGVEKVLLSLLNGLDRNKFEMTVLLYLNQGELRDEFPSHVRKVYLAKGKEDMPKIALLQKLHLLNRNQKLKKLLKNPEYIDKNILKDSYDIEIGMSYNDFEPVLNSSNKNSKKIGWFHSEINVPGFEPLVPLVLNSIPQFDYFVYCSKRISDLMHEHYPNLEYPAEAVIINAIPIEEIKTKAKEEVDFPDGPVFITVGRLHFRKGHGKLMEAHERLLKEGYRHQVIVIGDGEDMQKLTEMKTKLGVENTFHLVGNKMNPYPYMRKADFFILPSMSEAWPLVIAEALVLQKPIIATDKGDIADMVRDQETGILTEFNTESIYKAMKRFLTDKEFVEKLKKNLKNAEEQFDNKKIMNSVENILLTLVKK